MQKYQIRLVNQGDWVSDQVVEECFNHPWMTTDERVTYHKQAYIQREASRVSAYIGPDCSGRSYEF